MVGTRFYIKTAPDVTKIPFVFESTSSSIKCEPTEEERSNRKNGVVLHHGKISGYSSLVIPVVFYPDEINESLTSSVEVVFLHPDSENRLLQLHGSGSLSDMMSLSKTIVTGTNEEFNQLSRMTSIQQIDTNN